MSLAAVNSLFWLPVLTTSRRTQRASQFVGNEGEFEFVVDGNLGYALAVLPLDKNFAWFFDFLSDALGFMIVGLTDVMLWFPPVVMIVILAAAAYGLQRNWKITAGVFFSLLLVLNLGYWEETIQTLALVQHLVPDYQGEPAGGVTADDKAASSD